MAMAMAMKVWKALLLVVVLAACAAAAADKADGAAAFQAKGKDGVVFKDEAVLAKGLRVHSSLRRRMAVERLSRQKGLVMGGKHKHNRPFDDACEVDLRAHLPACEQSGEDWCWITGITEWSFYYNKSSLARGDNCSHVECSIASMDLKTNCCPLRDHAGCGVDSATVPHIVKVAGEVIGRPFASEGQALSEAALQASLKARTPVMPIIHWARGGGHALFVAGCTKGDFDETNYWLHDPLTASWRQVEYIRLLDYSLLEQGKWVDTVVPN